MNKLKAFFNRHLAKVVAVLAFALASVSAQAADPTTVEGIVTSSGSLIDSIKPIVIGAVAFSILVALVKMVRKGK